MKAAYNKFHHQIMQIICARSDINALYVCSESQQNSLPNTHKIPTTPGSTKIYYLFWIPKNCVKCQSLAIAPGNSVKFLNYAHTKRHNLESKDITCIE
jgi:hypothetical protein